MLFFRRWELNLKNWIQMQKYIFSKILRIRKKIRERKLKHIHNKYHHLKLIGLIKLTKIWLVCSDFEWNYFKVCVCFFLKNFSIFFLSQFLFSAFFIVFPLLYEDFILSSTFKTSQYAFLFLEVTLLFTY